MAHRLAFTLELPGENLAEYAARHAAIWPELRAAITAQGGRNYSIFGAPSLDRVFGYLEVNDVKQWEAGASSPLTRQWWDYMSDIMPTNPDRSPRALELIEVFHHG